MKDYPAAHSADTMWYIVDECGHVASCWSNESGAIPENAVTNIETPEEEEGTFMWHGDERASINSMDPSHVGVLAKTFEGKHADLRYRMGGTLYILSDFPMELEKKIAVYGDHPAVRPLVRTIEACPETGGRKLYLLGLFDLDHVNVAENDLQGWIHSEGICLSCVSAYKVAGEQIGPKREWTFHYTHPSANGCAYPYLLNHVPEKAKTLPELDISEADKESLRNGLVVEGCFKDRLFWQPDGELECQMYDDGSESVKVNDPDFEKMSKSSPFMYW